VPEPGPVEVQPQALLPAQGLPWAQLRPRRTPHMPLKAFSIEVINWMTITIRASEPITPTAPERALCTI